MRNWYYFNWLCGDHIVEQHIHNLDVINWLMDDYPVTAQGQGGRLVRTGVDNGQIYDHHLIEFTYANGHKMYSHCRHMPQCWNSVSEHVHGTNGYCNISGGRIFDKAGETRSSNPKAAVAVGNRNITTCSPISAPGSSPTRQSTVPRAQ